MSTRDDRILRQALIHSRLYKPTTRFRYPRKTAANAGLSDAVGEAVRGLEEQGVDERLWQVAAQLPLPDVEFLGEQSGRSTGRAVAFEPPYRLDVIALLVIGQRHQE